jgi:hypothetical protein
MQSSAGNVNEYLASLAEDRRAAIAAVRQTILDNLDGGYGEGMSYGMIGYFVPHAIFPAGYHCNPRDPLPFAGLAAQKNHMAVYLMALYLDAEGAEQEWFRQQWAKSGKRLDLGKSCIRFKKLADLDLATIGEAVRRMPAERYIALYNAARQGRK